PVLPGSVTAAAGGKPGDRLLTIDDRWTETLADLYEVAGHVKPGVIVPLSIQHPRKERALKVKLPEGQKLPFAVRAAAPRILRVPSLERGRQEDRRGKAGSIRTCGSQESVNRFEQLCARSAFSSISTGDTRQAELPCPPQVVIAFTPSS